MQTLTEKNKELILQEWWNPAYYIWYKEAIEWILKDIQEWLSVESIEQYLTDLLK